MVNNPSTRSSKLPNPDGPTESKQLNATPGCLSAYGTQNINHQMTLECTYVMTPSGVCIRTEGSGGEGKELFRDWKRKVVLQIDDIDRLDNFGLLK